MYMKMKNYIISIITIFTLLFGFYTSANAAGSVSASFAGNSSVTVGSTISLNINISSVSGSSDGKIYAFGGYITYDSSKLQYVSFSGASGWTGSTGSASSGRIKVATVDYSMSNGVSSGNVGTVKFKALAAGSATVSMNTIEVTDQEKNLAASFSGKTVTVNEPTPVTPKSSDSSLKSLGVSGYSLSPSFSSGTKSYSVSVPAGTSSVNVTATPNHSKASIVSGTGTVSLSSDKTTASVKVKAEDGSTSTYTITINREKKDEPTPEKPKTKSSDSLLKSLSVSGYTLSPTFSSNTKSYKMSVANGVTGLNVTAIPRSSKAKVSISGNHGWKVGANVITVTVTAEDGSKSTYNVTVDRAKKDKKVKSKDTNVDLKILSAHTMTPNFSNSTNDYNVTVANDVKKLDLSVIPYDKNAKVTISGNKELVDGKENLIKILVTAEDGTTRTINLKVKKSEEKSNAELLDIKVKDHTMTPAFSPSVTNYSVDVDSKTSTLHLTVKAPAGVTYEVNGNEDFQSGKNVVSIKVTDKAGFDKYYQIVVNKEAKKSVSKLMDFIPFIIILGLLFLILLLLFLLMLRKRRNNKYEEYDDSSEEIDAKQNTPINIDFKPEFNFNSKKDTDDDILYANGNLTNTMDLKKQIGTGEDPKVIDAEVSESVVDKSKVTKDDLYDAINESMETRELDKLQLLLEQERLNRKRAALEKKEKDN